MQRGWHVTTEVLNHTVGASSGSEYVDVVVAIREYLLSWP